MAVYLSTYQPGVGFRNSPAEVFTFPGGEVHLKNIPEDNPSTVYVADVRGADMHDLVAAAEWMDVGLGRVRARALLLPYLPAARADRGEPLAADVYARIINSIGASKVYTLDPHSRFMPGQVKNLVEVDPLPLVRRAIETIGLKYDAVIAPDEGAIDRAVYVANDLGAELICGEKQRDFDTGKLLGYKLPPLVKAGRYLVVDDICDGGGTFTLLAKTSGLPKCHLSLWVTHGIFSGKAYMLRDWYDHIYTTDSHPGSGRVGMATSILQVGTLMRNRMIEDLID